MSSLKRLKNSATNKKHFLVVGLLLAIFSVGLLFLSPVGATESKNEVNLYIFWGDGCPHCAQAEQTLKPYIEQHDNMGYKGFEIYYNVANQSKMRAVGEKLNVDASGVPFIIVGDRAYLGFSSSVGEDIKDRLDYCSVNTCSDSVAQIVGVKKPAQNVDSDLPNPDKKQTEESGADKIIDLPLFGEINASHISLPVLTVILGVLDGFNPCAMWALLFIITLLIGMNDRKRMWLFGTAFIVTSALVYLIFMAAWLNLFMFIGYVTWLRVLIGILALGIGVYYLYDWCQKRTGCKVTGSTKRKAFFEKLKEVVKVRNIWIGLAGVVLLAAAVNVVELACSAGLPVIYTGILSSADLATWQYYAYMLLYVLFFMLDDLIVFFIAMTTFKIVGIESKYTRATRLIGGILMLVIGLLLIVAPQILMLG